MLTDDTPASELVPLGQVDAQLTAVGAPFEIEEFTAAWGRMRTFKRTPPSLPALFDTTRCFDERTYLIYENERLTYAQVRQQVRRLSAWLRNTAGIVKGERVAIAMRNYPEAVVAFWATVSIGGVAVPLNAWWSGDELAYALEDSGAKLLFADDVRLIRATAGAARYSSLRAVLVRGTTANTHTSFTTYAWKDVIGFSDDNDTSISNETASIAPDDDATLFYTSGTTGHPKGALGTHRNICSCVMSTIYGRASALLRRGEPLPDANQPLSQKATLLTVPLFHVTGCHSILATGTAAGGKLVMMYKWDPVQALAIIERENISTFGGVPTVVWQILECPALAHTDVSSVESIGYGGAPAAPELVSRIRAQFPNVLPGTGWGLTESSSGVTTHTGIDYLQRPSSVGRAAPVTDIKAVDTNGNEVAPNQSGELLIRGPGVVKEYWNQPAATAATFRNGWLHTGDIGRIDEEGFIYILDRAKDMVIRGGENIYCVEVEDALFSHPGIIDAAVFGVPHNLLGEEVAAAVQLTQGTHATVTTIRQYLADRIAAFKVPAHITIYDQPLPRNANGKIIKPALHDEFLGTQATSHYSLGDW